MNKLLAALLLGTAVLLGGCSIVDTEASHESVLMDRPLIFGQGGLRPYTFTNGRQYTWLTTEAHQIDLRPYTVPEVFDDLTTSEGSYVDFTTSLTIRVTDAVAQYKLGDKWYQNNLQRPYQEIVRREVRKYALNKLRTDSKVQDQIETDVRAGVNELIKELKLPVQLIDMNLGKATPNKEVQAQIDRTTAEQQRKLTMDEFKKAEDARKEAEASRANADNEYRNAMGLSPSQFVELESIRRYSDACKAAQSCTILSGVNSPVVVGK